MILISEIMSFSLADFLDQSFMLYFIVGFPISLLEVGPAFKPNVHVALGVYVTIFNFNNFDPAGKIVQNFFHGPNLVSTECLQLKVAL